MGLIFNTVLADIVSVLLFIIIAAYFFVKHRYTYWERHGIKSLKPSFPSGNFSKSFLQKISIGEMFQEQYQKFSDRFFGVYIGIRPLLVFRDPELIRGVLTKDFQYFHDHGTYIDEKNDPLSAHLFAMSGPKWKNLRVKLSPTFTSGKLKAMFPTIIECSKTLESYLEKMATKNEIIDVSEIAARHSTNVITSIAFGIDVNCIDDPESGFRKYGRKIFQHTFKNGVRFLLMVVYPALLKLIRIRGVDQDVEDFFTSVVKQNLDYREKNNISRKDFFQLLIQLRNTGNVQLDGHWDTVITNDEKQKKLTLNEVVAQSYVFFFAGFETSSATMSFCLYELARKPETQRKVQEEIDEVLRRHDGKVTYESVAEMKYLECCIDETLRMYPPAPTLHRDCTIEYKIPGSNIVIEKGTGAVIPVLAIHRDEKYFPEPDNFIPERFNEENSAGKTFVDRPYMPFGDGPRVCIGQRLGKIQVKLGLIAMLQRFSYELSDVYNKKSLRISPLTFILSADGGVNLKVKYR